MSDIKLFEEKKVRSIWNEKEEKWFFSVIDVIEILTGSSIPKRYWADLKSKLIKEGSEAYDKIVRLKIIAEDGKTEKLILRIQKLYFVSFNLFLRQKQNLLSNGWLKLDMNECKKFQILNKV